LASSRYFLASLHQVYAIAFRQIEVLPEGGRASPDTCSSFDMFAMTDLRMEAREI
jgi:hypothetical protein